MGDRITIIDIKIIQDDLIQIDFENEETGKINRCFCEGKEFFRMIGISVLKKYLDKY